MVIYNYKQYLLFRKLVIRKKFWIFVHFELKIYWVYQIIIIIQGIILMRLNYKRFYRKATEKALLDSEQAILETADIIKQTRKYDNIENNLDISADEDR